MQNREIAIKVTLDTQDYNIFIGFGTLKDLGDRIKDLSGKGVVISNPTIISLYGEKISKSLSEAGIDFRILSIPEGEEYKSLESASRLYDDLTEFQMQRSDFILALGGGVIGDLSGFVAATYMRGVPFIQVPTSLLAQVDSSVGGKVAVNHRMGKNLIGSFYQPRFVQIDIDTLKTLPESEFRAGMAEVVKCGFLIGKDFLSYLEMNLEDIMMLNPDTLTEVIEQCCRFKARTVEADERDFGVRAILNYGHSFGHAIEAASEYKHILHGEAISVGMVGAALIAKELGWIDQALVDRHVRLLQHVGLPIKMEGLNMNMILSRLALDKKGARGAAKFVLLRAPGRPEIVEVSHQMIERVLPNLI
jgi:3-dehydroquinate synthase